MRRILAVAALALSATGCRTAATLRPLPPGDPRPQALLDAFEKGAEARHSLRGRARIEVEGATGARLAGRQIVVAERPARLRIEVLGLFDQSLAVLTTDGERFELFRSSDLHFEEGELRPGLLWEQAQIALRPDQAIPLLLGVPPPEPGLVPVRAQGAKDGRVRVALAPPGGPERRRLEFDGEGRLIRIEALDADGELEWSAGFSDYEPVGGVPFAHSIRLWVVAGETLATIHLKNVELNPELPPGVWSVRPLQSAAAGGPG